MTTKQITYNGVTQGFRAHCRDHGIAFNTARDRLHNGLPLEEVFRPVARRPKATEVPTDEWIRRMRATKAWQAREVFRPGDMANTLGCEKETIGRICRTLYQDGRIERIDGVHSVQWRAPVPSVLSMAWRKRSNEQLGIES